MKLGAQHIATLINSLSSLNLGLLTTSLADSIKPIALNLKGNALEYIDSQFLPEVLNDLRKNLQALPAVTSVAQLTSADYVGAINKLIERYSVAHKFYCTQSKSTTGNQQVTAFAKKAILANILNWINKAYVMAIKTAGAAGVSVVDREINAAQYANGLENYAWDFETLPVNVSFFGLTNTGQQSPLTIGNTSLVVPEMPVENIDFESLIDGIEIPGKDQITEKVKGGIDQVANNPNILLWVVGAAVGGYALAKMK